MNQVQETTISTQLPGAYFLKSIVNAAGSVHSVVHSPRLEEWEDWNAPGEGLTLAAVRHKGLSETLANNIVDGKSDEELHDIFDELQDK